MFHTINLRNYRKVISFVFVLALILYAVYFMLKLFYPIKYVDVIMNYSAEFNIEPSLVCAIINAESRFDPGAISHRGASGLMQLIPRTADWGAEELNLEDYSYDDDILEPEINIQIGCWYLSKLLNQYNHITPTAVAAYNAGSGTVSGWLSDTRYSADGQRLLEIPYGETRKYVKKIEHYEKVYDFLLDYFYVYDR